MSTNETHQGTPSGVAASAPSEHGKPVHDVEVMVDYISADDPIHQKFAPDTRLGTIKQWAREQFVPVPPSDKVYSLNDDKTRHRFTPEEEGQTLAELGYEHQAKLRLNEEQASGGHRADTCGPRP